MEDLLFNLIEYIANNMIDLQVIDEDYGQLEMHCCDMSKIQKMLLHLSHYGKGSTNS